MNAVSRSVNVDRLLVIPKVGGDTLTLLVLNKFVTAASEGWGKVMFSHAYLSTGTPVSGPMSLVGGIPRQGYPLRDRIGVTPSQRKQGHPLGKVTLRAVCLLCFHTGGLSCLTFCTQRWWGQKTSFQVPLYPCNLGGMDKKPFSTVFMR